MTPFFILVIVLTFGLGLWANSRVKSAYNRYRQFGASCGVTGAEAARMILQSYGVRDVEVVEGRGTLTDHYDPGHRRLVLSPENFRTGSVAALGIAAHEAGHAIQHAERYAPLQWRMAAVGITGFASQLVFWVPILGLLGGLIPIHTVFLLMALGMGVLMLFQLITLPVEFDATKRAKAILSSTGMIQAGPEQQGMNRVLDAAAWTYVAAFISTFAWFLYYLLPLLSGRD